MLLGIHEESNKIVYEKIDSYKYVPVFIIRDTEDRLKMRKKETLKIEPHWHRSIEIMYTNQSCNNVIVINGERVDLPKETIYVVNSRDIHYVEMPDEPILYTGYTIQLSYSFLKEVCPDFDNRRFYVNEESKNYILPIIEMIIKLYFENIIRNKNIITNLSRALIEVLITYSSKTLDLANQSLDKKLLKILAYIDENYNQELNIQEIAKKYNISYTYLSKLFKSNLGMTANQYINKLRYENAFIDIATTKRTITEIAFIHGFPNVYALTREFKNNKGMLPSEYRRLIDKTS